MSYIGQQLPADVFSGFVTDSFTGDGSATTFTLSKAPFSEDTLIVVINNVIQKPTTNFTVSGTTLTIVGTAVASGDIIYAIHTGGVLPITTASAVTAGATIDLNGGSDKLILDADADTTISADTDDQIDFKAGGTDTMHIINGKVGIGTTSPSTNLHIFSTSDNAPHLLLENFQNADTDDAPIIELYTNDQTTGGIGDDTDVGVIRFTGDEKDGGTKETYAEIRGVAHDPGSGSSNRGNLSFFVQKAGSLAETVTLDDSETVFNDGGQDHDFRVESDTNTHALFVLASSGDSRVGINNSNPASGALSPRETVANYQMIYAEHTAASGNIYGIHAQFTAQDPDNNTSRFFAGGNDTFGNRYLVYADGDVVNHDNSYGSISDSRIKSNIVDANSQWDDIKALKVRNYKKNDDITKYGDKAWVQIGVIAQELEAAGMDKLVKNETKYEAGDLEVVNGNKNVDDIKEYKSVKYSVLYMKAIKALQEAMAKIETLETKVKTLEDA